MEYKIIQYAQNGAALKGIELSEEQSVIPEGALHKNKHHLDLDGVTKKGIPVIQNVDDSVETLEEIKQYEEQLQQSAEIEESEVIFSKELTDFLEEKRQEWHDSDSPELILEEVGKRVTKELLKNTDDRTGLINKLSDQELF